MRKKAIAKACAILIASVICAAFALFLIHAPVFETGKNYELYYGASSSASATGTRNPVRDKLLSGCVAGESVRYDGDRAAELMKRYRAKVLFSEEAEGVVNYYCYSPLLGDGIGLCGYAVNLHVAVGSEQTAIGIPIIFGGF